MNIARTLVVASLIACVSAPTMAADARSTTRIVKGLAMQGGNAKVIEALKVLEQEGFLEQMSTALQDGGAASATAQPATAAITQPAGAPAGAPATGAAASAPAADATAGDNPAAPSVSDDQIAQIAYQAAEPTMSKHMGGHVTIGQKWVKKTTRGGRPIYEVKIMPESLGIVSFFVTYTIDVDQQTMKVTRIK